MLTVGNAALIIIDMQEKLTRAMSNKEYLVTNLQKLISGLRLLGVPMIHTEQYPQGLGLTITEVSSLLPDTKPIMKMEFSCCGNAEFLAKLKALNKKQILIAGIEGHVCVYQTTADLLIAGYEVQIVTDCVSSRTNDNKTIAIEKMRNLGAQITSTEIVLFELLRTAEHKNFKDISRIVK